MTLRKYSMIAFAIAVLHASFVFGATAGSTAIAMGRTSTELPGRTESFLDVVANTLLVPLGFLWAPTPDTSAAFGFAAIGANSLLWGIVFAALIAVVSGARTRLAAT